MSDTIIKFEDIDEHGPQTYAGKFDVPASELGREEAAGGGAAQIDVTVSQGDLPGEYLAEGTAVVTADLECSRCVEAYPFANTSPFHVRFRPRPESAAEANDEIEIAGEEELDVEFYAGRTVPLRDLAVEQLQLAMPMKPLCDESCLGLCPKCGVNRSRESCNCDSSVTDERWGALQAIRDELSKKRNV
jgi:uncharacterized protein